MIMRREDINGDFVFGHGLADYLTEDAAIALLVKQRILLWLGEWFLDITAGIDWPNILGSKPPAFTLVESEIRTCVLNTPGVELISNLEMSFDHRTYTIDMYLEITTEFSAGIVVRFRYPIRAGVL